MTKIKFQLLITAVISLLIGLTVGITIVHLFTGAAPGLESQWRQYVRF